MPTRYLSIRTKLIVPFAFTIMLALFGLLPATTALVGRRIESEADRRLAQTGSSVAALIQGAEKQALLSANFVANLPELRVAGVDEESINTLLIARQVELDLRELSLYPATYEPGTPPIFYGGPVVARRLQVSEEAVKIRDMLIGEVQRTGRSVSGIAITPQASQILGVAPVFASMDGSRETVGIVVAAQLIDQAFISEISEVLGADIAIVKDNDVVVSTIDRASGYETLLEQGFIDPTKPFSSQNITYNDARPRRLLATPLMLHGLPQATVLIAQSISDLSQARQDIQLALAAFASVIALVSAIFGTAIYLSFARPITTLAHATRRVSAGDLNQQLPIPQVLVRDEISDLVGDFNMMVDRLRSLYTGLEQRVAERTSELVQERNKLDEAMQELALARDRALEANRAKNTFLANMSHELRTPLTAVIGYGEMLLEEAMETGPEHFVVDLNKIINASKHLLGLINDILDLSKIEAGKVELYLETFDVETMVKDVSTTIQPMIHKNNNQYTLNMVAPLGTMHADLTKVRQILFNLLSNASKFANGKRIIFEVAREMKGGTQWIVFRVTDFGIGMTSEQLERIFQPFTQADPSTTRKFGGTGLGLAISRIFCQMMGGDIFVQSEMDAGSTFMVRLPVEVVLPGEDGISPLAPEPASVIGSNGRTILVIDDDPAVGELMSRHLAREGFKVEVAANGQEGLRLARQLQPDAITLDVMLPDQDGWSILAALKAESPLDEIPVVMLTFVDDKSQGFALGAADYLTKPIDRDRLLSVLNKHQCGTPPCRIMIVEDDTATRETLRRLLEKRGWQVIEAENGRVALQRLAEETPSLILLDLMMPEMDGFGFLAALREGEAQRHAGIPIVVLTAKELTTEERLWLNGSVERVLQKGTTGRDQLVQEVRELVSHRLRERPQHSEHAPEPLTASPPEHTTV